MFSNSGYNPGSNNTGGGQEQRPPFSHSHSQSSSNFSVAGMSNFNQNAAHSPNLRSSSLGMSMSSSMSMGSSLGDSMAQTRTHYQPGYLMSVSQANSAPQGGSHHDSEAPLVPTKARLNHTLSGGSVTEFGMDSMFESSRQRSRQTLDEDAPPTASVHDIVNETFTDSTPSRFMSSQRTAFEPSQSRASLFRPSQPSTPRPSVQIPQTTSPAIYVVVFGYPPDKYSVTAEYFRSLGETTEPEQSGEISNAFRIGYVHPAEAVRAVRKNGEVLGGSWMVGAKWADPNQAEALLGQSLMRGTFQSPDRIGSPDKLGASSSPSGGAFAAAPSSSRMDVDEMQVSTPVVGTPIRLAPSAAAFRRGGPPMAAKPHVQPAALLPAAAATPQPSPSKGVIGQVSDLIFGW